MNEKNAEIYSEVYQIFNLLGNEYISKIPSSLFNMIEKKRDTNYNPQYNEDILLNKQNIKKETIAIIALIHLNYWCENEEEKFEIKKMLKNNEDKYQEELRKKYNIEKLFEKRKQKRKVENQIAMIQKKSYNNIFFNRGNC